MNISAGIAKFSCYRKIYTDQEIHKNKSATNGAQSVPMGLFVGRQSIPYYVGN